MSPLNLNRACNLEDFRDEELLRVMREVFGRHVERHPGYPAGREHRKHWEVAMAVMSLGRHGVLRPDAEVLGIGAGAEPTLFWLTCFVRRVFATDMYLAPGAWVNDAPARMLGDPGAFWDGPWRGDRLVVQHMNACSLAYESGSFDGIFSSGSIEHFGELSDIATAMDEACRVLKVGGIASLSTELRLKGPAPGIVPMTAMFDRQMIEEIVIGDRPWELVDELTLEVSEPTLATEVDVALATADVNHASDNADGPVQGADIEFTEYPHLVFRLDRFAFTSVHVALRKVSRGAARRKRLDHGVPLANRLARLLPEPPVIIDGGVRWGFGEHWEKLLPDARLIGFEPDQGESDLLIERYADAPEVQINALALGSTSGRSQLNAYRAGSSNSLYRHDESWLSRFAIDRSGDVVDGTSDVETVALDDWLPRQGLARVDAMKLDVEGAELEILRGATHTLETVRMLEVEVTFNPLRQDAPLFGEVDAYLRTLGFGLWRLRDLVHYPIKGGDDAPPATEHIVIGQEHASYEGTGLLSWANAHFVRVDAFLESAPVAWQSSLRDACLAAALEFNDLTLIALRRLVEADPPEQVRLASEHAIDDLVAAGADPAT